LRCKGLWPRAGLAPFPAQFAGEGVGMGAAAACAEIGRNAPNPTRPSLYFSTTTPFQNATWPAMFFAASLGSG